MMNEPQGENLDRLKREGVGLGSGGKKGDAALDLFRYVTGRGSMLSRVLRIRVSRIWRVLEAVWTSSFREDALSDRQLIGIPFMH
jgi:hypothetical protein